MKRNAHAAWLNFAGQATLLAWESQEVVALRTLRLAGGGPRAALEATIMVAEKVAAAAEMQSLLLAGAGRGPAGVVALYRRKVRANRRRLRKG